MLMKEVLESYGGMVSFPLTVRKIEKEGFNVKAYLCSLADALRECEDKDSSITEELFKLVDELKLEEDGCLPSQIALN